LSECSSTDKLLLVVGLKSIGEIVAVTGDGTNDAPSLKLSDVGMAMQSGSIIAKDSAKITLQNN